MRRRFLGTASLFLLLLAAGAVRAGAEDAWTFQLFGGAPYNLTTPLRIRQSGQAEIKLDARYKSEPFTSPLYYAWRIGRWREQAAWELELVHNKLYLKNKPAEVQEFSISHGFNLLTANRAWMRGGFIYRAGAGVVVTHPENTIRGKTLPEDRGLFSGGYYISGPTLQISAEKRFRIRKGLFAALEAKLSASYARVPVEDGRADVTNVAVHGLFGLGYSP